MEHPYARAGRSTTRAARGRAAAAGIVAAAIALTGCAGGGGNAAATTDTLTIAIQAAPTSLALPTNCTNAVFALAYEPLIRVDADGGYEPGIAESWEYSDNNTVFTMDIRDDVKFADGTDLTAQSVVDTLTYYRDNPGLNQGYLEPFTVIEAGDDNTVRIEYDEPFIGMETLLASDGECNNGLIISAAGLADPDKMATDMFGAGPYVLDTADTVFDDHYTYTKNPNYYEPDRQHWEKVVVRVIADPNTAYAAVQSGQVQVSMVPDTGLIEGAEAKGIDVSQGQVQGTAVMLFDRAGEQVPALADERVRMALNLAVDRQSIADALGEGNEPIAQFAVNGFLGSDPSADYDYDPEQAKQLLADAGYADGFELPIITPAVGGADTATQAVIAQWAEIGVTAVANPTAAGDFFGAIGNKQYPATIVPYGMLGDVYFDAVRLYKQPYSNVWNPFRSTDPDLDAAYSSLATATTPEEVETRSIEFNTVMTEKSWFVPITQAYAPVFSKGIDIGTSTALGAFDIVSWAPSK
ncbi:ABC transporter substrate-binding protein [Microbacterium sp. NPDC089695]|uniref:ABC transporter substrate-binding protein n=1 Tax=Microbacterium sp. NPDC089695 TaxID=3364198 RepID=UPI00380B9442